MGDSGAHDSEYPIDEGAVSRPEMLTHAGTSQSLGTGLPA